MFRVANILANTTYFANVGGGASVGATDFLCVFTLLLSIISQMNESVNVRGHTLGLKFQNLFCFFTAVLQSPPQKKPLCQQRLMDRRRMRSLHLRCFSRMCYRAEPVDTKEVS
jgi:hypothetical protein